MSFTAPEHYYNRFDPTKRFEQHLFRAGYVMQSAEFNEVQSHSQDRLKRIADAIFKDGDIIAGVVCTVNDSTGAVVISEGTMYLRGAVRVVPEGSFTIPTVGTYTLGLYMTEAVVTELEDQTLRDPAIGMRNYQEPGASRLRFDLSWGYASDGQSGEFYAVFSVINGILQIREVPPNLDVISTAIATYDRQSTGGTYIIDGMQVTRQADSESGEQVLRVSAGSARVSGRLLSLLTDQRIVRTPTPDVATITSEPHLSATTDPQRIDTDRSPIASITQVTITKEVTESVVHGGYIGVADSLANSPVIAIISVTQSETTYTEGADYTLTAGKVNWSLGGLEPAIGSTYSVTYRYVAVVTPTAVDATGFTVEDAVAGTLVNVTYQWKRPRYDRMYMDQEGNIVWQNGVPHDDYPVKPSDLPGMLLLTTVYQSWRAGEDALDFDGSRVVEMSELNAMRYNISDIYAVLASQQLMIAASARTAAAKKGIFADSFKTNALRDLGVTQNAWNVGGALTLPIATAVNPMPADISAEYVTLAKTDQIAIAQESRTSTTKVNPYLSVEPLPAQITLKPATDNYADTQTTWLSAVWGSRSEVRTISTKETELAIRQLAVSFTVQGFGDGETIASLTFDGIAVSPTAGAANSAGVLTGSFTIPAGIPAGAKQIEIIGSGGSRGLASYVAKNTLISVEKQQVNVQQRSSGSSSSSSGGSVFYQNAGGGVYSGSGATYTMTSSASRQTFAQSLNSGMSASQAARAAGASCTRGDPVAQTFQLDQASIVSGVDLWFTTTSATPIYVMIRNVENGAPTPGVVAAAFVLPSDIVTTGPTRVTFTPVILHGGIEYAITVLSDDTDVALAVAEIGKWDAAAGQWITRQPYQVGVMLTSSNNTTWTPHQTEDLTFRLVSPAFTESTRAIDMGTLAVTDASDLMVMADVDNLGADAMASFRLTLLDRDGAPAMTVAPWQQAQLTERYTGNVKIEAILTGSASASPVLYPDAQLAIGDIDESANYVTREFPVNGGTDVTVRYVALLPAGASVLCEIYDGSAWSEIALDSTAPVGDDWIERTHIMTGFSGENARIRLTLAGTTAARPYVANLTATFI